MAEIGVFNVGGYPPRKHRIEDSGRVGHQRWMFSNRLQPRISMSQEIASRETRGRRRAPMVIFHVRSFPSSFDLESFP